MPDRFRVEVEGRQLEISNLDKVLYPQVGFTKAEVIDYYTRVGPTLLPHLAGRPLTRTRYPNGVDGNSFFEKNAPAGTPDWIRTVRLPVPGSSRNREKIDFILVDELATVVWLANLAALELHTPQWRVNDEGSTLNPDQLVVDLDPGPPAGLPECYEVALLLRDRLAADGLSGCPKTSGKKGMQLVVPLPGDETADELSAYAKAVADELSRAHPSLVVSKMAKQLRPGKVFIDWSQNNAFKTTVAPYSLRAGALPTVSAPLTWDEVEAGELTAADLTPSAVLTRVAELGDLLTR
ncbi:non-homologous end-joining DNA ligase [Dactylosporangium sp. AC04546]|uniref:non-homologous end-joining DNA ligase n=1 Tax=Dactylosporangium sp. AC04546 TaxID=2862460 RepID=UPI001EDD376B|nr:non-homologous end-joining DNA ligase [Dactylosporangium sp. AC04546]WVK84499.1 non-homologous end-joining DNA ligase [Dactylosporangium sp. AC04546]